MKSLYVTYEFKGENGAIGKCFCALNRSEPKNFFEVEKMVNDIISLFPDRKYSQIVPLWWKEMED